MFSETLYARYYDPCCSGNSTMPDTAMCDTTFQFNNGFQNAATAESYDFLQVDVEMDSLMRTLSDNPDFFDHAAFPAPTSSTTLQDNYIGEYAPSEGPRMFAAEFYEPSPTTPTPVASPDPPPSLCEGSAQFEDFSLATHLPVLNGYNTAYTVPEPTTAKFQTFEPYSAHYFFTTPPDTPPSVYPATISAQPAPYPRHSVSSSSADSTPTIRKLLQQKKKRITAVPCHVNSVCTTCQTRTTSLWRRNHLGEIECNACNLYFRKNNCKRPVTLRKDEIMKRKRKPRVESAHHSTDTTAANSLSSVDVKPSLFS